MSKAKRTATAQESRASDIQATMTAYAAAHNATLIEWPDRVEQAAKAMAESVKFSEDDRADARELVKLVGCFRLQCERGEVVVAGYDALRIGFAVQRINNRYSDTDKIFFWAGTPVELSPMQMALAREVCGGSRLSARRLKRLYVGPDCELPSDGALDTALSRLRTTLADNDPPIRVRFTRRGDDVLVMDQDA